MNRSKEKIIADVMSIVREDPKKTHIMYRANLSYTLLCKYLNRLIEAGFVDCRAGVYSLTDKGEAYLVKYAEYERLRTQLESNMLSLNEKEAVLTEILCAFRKEREAVTFQ